MATATEQITGTYVLDPIHSSASFAVKHMVVSTFRGRFEKFDATLIDGKLVGTVDVGSIVVNDENLAAHLRSPELFDAERYPELRFESTDIRRTEGDEVRRRRRAHHQGHHEVRRGPRHASEGPAVTFGDVNKIGLTLEAIIDRTDCGLNWNAPLPKGGFALAERRQADRRARVAEQA